LGENDTVEKAGSINALVAVGQLKSLVYSLCQAHQRVTRETLAILTTASPARAESVSATPTAAKNSPARCAQQHMQHKQQQQLVAATRPADTNGWEPGLQMAHHHPSRRGNPTCQLLPDGHRCHG